MRELPLLLRQLSQLLGPERRWRWVLLVAMALGITLLEVVGAAAIFALLALIGDAAGADGDVAIGPLGELLPSTDTTTLQVTVALGLVAFFVLRSVALSARAYVEGRILTGASVELADRFLAGYVAMPYLFHTRRGSAELIRNSFSSTEGLRGSVLQPLALLVAEFVLITGLTVLLFVSDPFAATLAAAVLGTAVLVIQRILRPRLRVWGRLSHEATKGTIESIQQALGGIRDLKLLGREQEFLAAHGRHRRRLARSAYLSAAAASIPRALIELGLVTTIVGVFLVSILAGPERTIELSTLGLFAYAGIRLQPALQLAVNALNTLRFSSPVVADLIADDLLIRREVAARQRADEAAPMDGSTFAERIELRDVTFDYGADGGTPTSRPALDGIDLVVRRGEFLGICGPTGGGKSTLLDVLVGLLPPTSGQVLIDGHDVTERRSWWWSQLGVVSQSVFLTDDTLRRNIAFGRSGADLDEERLARCVSRAQLDEVIAGLPDGLDTVVGERGVRLSGGQRQRVAIARALYREPEVLVLDEGTSALDGATEAAIMGALEEVSGTRTLIAVAHRLTTIRRADRIVVIADGRIAAEGGWDELAASDPTFRAMLSVGDAV